MIGKTISHYKVLEKLGEGGMGVVYKAEDTKLKRDVAIKFLPHQITASDEERERFKVEAQAAARLNHPNIATIYNIEEVDDEIFIVMEYIDGKELKDKIDSNPLGIDDTLDISLQIAKGLQAAHDKGVTHRDIKSANIMFTEKGDVKIMDFGLAKMRGGAKLTLEQSTLGTAPYMSPEQARGADVDHRTDVFSLGVLLYEMLTGQLPFKGDYHEAIIYSILNEDHEPITGLRSGIPLELERVVNKCLQKEASSRYQHADELQVDLQSLQKTQESGISSVQTTAAGSGFQPVPTRRSLSLIGSVAALVLLVTLAIAFLFRSQRPADLKIVSTRPLTSAPGSEGWPTWSPDGTRLAYNSDESGKRDIWVRQLRVGQSVNLTKDYPGTSNRVLDWSPDGEWLAFLSNRGEAGLFIMPALGGNPRQILSLEQRGWVQDASWSPDGSKLVFVQDSIYTVSAQGGRPSTIPFVTKALFLQDAVWSPDGTRIAISEIMGVGISTSRLWTLRPDGTDPRAITDATSLDTKPVWMPDGKRLLFISDRGGSSDIWSIPVDESGEAAGPAKALTTGVGVGDIALSADGSKLAYEKIVENSSIWSMPIAAERPLTMEDAQLITSENSFIENIAISHDGEWLAIDSNRSGNVDIWILRTDGSDLRQITTHPAHDWHPTWSPDGKRIAFHSVRSGNRDIWLKPVAGGPGKQLTTDPDKNLDPLWSPHSDEIAFSSFHSGSLDIWIVSESTSLQKLPFYQTKAARCYMWSPDGKKLVVTSRKTGKAELYLLSTNSSQMEQLTHGELGNSRPFAWSADGSTIYTRASNNIYAISATDGTSRRLTNFEFPRSKWFRRAASDGERFYLLIHEKKSDIWLAELAEEE